jgi:DNA excision repair protein ERCC-4
LVVVNAHRVTATSGEAFAVRLLRGSGNATAFVRALSDRPGELCRGFCTAESVLKALLLRNVYLWPRFHLSVRDALEARPPEVVEFRQPLTRTVRLIQEALLEVMGACLSELRRSRLVDTSELTLEAGLFRSFDRVLSRQLEPVWHTTPRRLRQAVADLRTLRGLAQCLLRYDAVTFLRHLENLRAAEARDSLCACSV